LVIWYIFPRVGKLYQEKSGNPESDEAEAQKKTKKKKTKKRKKRKKRYRLTEKQIVK
jgi:hypothetical protein